MKILRITRSVFFRRNRILLFYKQLSVAKALTEYFKANQAGKDEIKRLIKAIAGTNNKKEKEGLEIKLEDIQIRLFAHKNLVRILKTIVDGIVWRNTGFDRPILRLIASNRKTGFIDIAEPGLMGVLNVAKSIMWNRKSIVIINW